MNDLNFVVDKTLELISATALTQKYQELINAITSLQNSPSAENENAVSLVRNEIVSLHKQFTPDGWTYNRNNLWTKLRCEELLGTGGISFMNRTYRNISMPANASNDVQGRLNHINELVQRLGQIKAGLGDLGVYKELELPEGYVYVEIVFSKKTAIKTVKELEGASDEWVKVFQGYNRMLKRAEEDVEIAYLNKVNPIIEGLVISSVVSSLIEKTLTPLIRVRSEWLKSQVYAEKLKRSRLKTSFLRRGWEKSYDKIEEAEIVRISEKLVKENKHLLAEGSSQAEVTEFVKKNTKFIADFVKNGGSIDISADPKGKFTAKMKLSGSYRKMHLLEDKVENLLEAPKLPAKAK